MVCCCSLAGSAACKNCQNNPNYIGNSNINYIITTNSTGTQNK